MFDRFGLNLFQLCVCRARLPLILKRASNPHSRFYFYFRRFYFNIDFYCEVIDSLHCKMRNQQCTEWTDVFAIQSSFIRIKCLLCSASCQVLGTQCWIKHCEPWTDPISLLYNDFPGGISRKVIVSRNGRDSCCPLVTYRTLNLVTFSWIESPPLIGTLLADVLKDSWKDLWNCPGYRHFFKCSVTMHLYLKKLCFLFSAFSNVQQNISLEYQIPPMVHDLIFIPNFIKCLLKASNTNMLILILEASSLVIHL